ncbi:MAG: RidA family protein [Pyrinomonadaceae bacterium]
METKNAPVTGGHFSQAVVHNGLVFVSGQLSIDPHTGEMGSISTSLTTPSRRRLEAISSFKHNCLPKIN